MTFAAVSSRSLIGVKTFSVRIEVHLSRGLPSFTLVGLPEKAVKESKDRVRSALINSGFDFPTKRIVVNLSPADLPKEGSRFDLPIALGILVASQQLEQHALVNRVFIGELTLDGQLRDVPGVLPIALATHAKNQQLVVPRDNVREASMVKGMAVHGLPDLLSTCQFIKGLIEPPESSVINQPTAPTQYPDMSEVQGQAHVKRALEIAASGGHSVLLSGPPGCGKTMLASRLPGILPPLSHQEAAQTAVIYSISHHGFQAQHWQRRPFRAPHHSASSAALVGGGNPPRPGEISLAHNGVLFLDEVAEFQRHVLQSLREPLESGHITIARASRCISFPCQFQLIAAMNPCPCGYITDQEHSCECRPDQIERYQAKLSGPLKDRLDMLIEVPRLDPMTFFSKAKNSTECSSTIRRRVTVAQDKQQRRSTCLNSQLSHQQVSSYCQLNAASQRLLQQAMQRQRLSSRGLNRVLRVARTIADMADSMAINEQHISEAISLRYSMASPQA